MKKIIDALNALTGEQLGNNAPTSEPPKLGPKEGIVKIWELPNMWMRYYALHRIGKQKIVTLESEGNAQIAKTLGGLLSEVGQSLLGEAPDEGGWTMEKISKAVNAAMKSANQKLREDKKSEEEDENRLSEEEAFAAQSFWKSLRGHLQNEVGIREVELADGKRSLNELQIDVYLVDEKWCVCYNGELTTTGYRAEAESLSLVTHSDEEFEDPFEALFGGAGGASFLLPMLSRFR